MLIGQLSAQQLEILRQGRGSVRQSMAKVLVGNPDAADALERALGGEQRPLAESMRALATDSDSAPTAEQAAPHRPPLRTGPGGFRRANHRDRPGHSNDVPLMLSPPGDLPHRRYFDAVPAASGFHCCRSRPCPAQHQRHTDAVAALGGRLSLMTDFGDELLRVG